MVDERVLPQLEALTIHPSRPLLVVDDVLKALEQLVANDRPKGQKRREKRGGKNSAGSKTAQNLSEAG